MPPGTTPVSGPPTGPVSSPPAPAADPQVSEAARELRAYYARVEADLIDRGMLRTERAPADAPFGARSLARNFEQVAFFSEYTETGGGRFEERRSPTALRRWEGPIRMQVIFGASVPEDRRRRDLAEIRALNARLAVLTGLDIALTGINPNFRVLILGLDERRSADRWLPGAAPGLSPTILGEIMRSPPDTFCSAFSVSPINAPYRFSEAVVLIKDEHPALLRRSCIHEEIVQSLGLSNDSPSARPSIFNDDEEFALLTAHDDLLLRMLYDPALKPGMSANEARPTVKALAEAWSGGRS